ncbi:MAG: class I SAM-dependent methyltransferase [Gammaproteobacteria bacterium]|nr:class I SAM-dependent methyltransferase [Gammaproteobacteria bacterium]
MKWIHRKIEKKRSALDNEEASRTRRQMRQWYQASHLGSLLLELETELLNDLLPTLFGYNLVQIGCLVDQNLLHSSQIPLHIVTIADAEPDLNTPDLVACPGALPIASDSVDLVVLHHTLEFAQDPHQVLREVDRILIAEGHVVILGFNPLSVWGLWRLLFRRGDKPPWCANFRDILRIKDWLALMGFDISAQHYYAYRPPIHHQSLTKKLQFIERLGERFVPRLGGAYALVAKKRECTLTPIKPRWWPRRAFVSGLAKPATGRCPVCKQMHDASDVGAVPRRDWTW